LERGTQKSFFRKYQLLSQDYAKLITYRKGRRKKEKQVELEVTYSEATKSLISRLRHPSIQKALKSNVVLHPFRSNCIYIEIAENADAQIVAHHFDGDEVIYTVDLFVDDVDGNTNNVFSWTTTDWKEVRSKIIELKGLV
jgi:hypothetical protein